MSQAASPAGQPLTPDQLRHTYATTLANSDMSLPEVSKWSTRSAASMNDIGTDQRRQTMTIGGTANYATSMRSLHTD